MEATLRALRRPGAMREVAVAAPSRMPSRKHEREGQLPMTSHLIKEGPGYTARSKSNVLDRGLDKLVRASGSPAAFGTIQVALWGWALAGTALYKTTLWPVAISDAQAIFSYMFDSFLMRQQLNGYYEGLNVAAELKSRSCSNAGMLRLLYEQVGSDSFAQAAEASPEATMGDMRLPAPSRFTRVIDRIAAMLGHIAFILLFWACMFLWLGFGPLNNWSNKWQLDINSSTSALMVFVFSFLAILRERHSDEVRACLDAIYRIDSTLELKLRLLTGNRVENPSTHIPAARVNGLQRAINYYADVIGTLIGIALLLLVIVVWLAIGPALHFDSNWWLLIGTYAGLVGLNDGFVLRNVQANLREHEEPQYAALESGDRAVFASLGLSAPTTAVVDKCRISYRVSERMNRICGHEAMVVLGLLLIVGLLTGASVLRWTETGQLLCNVPPSIIESFFMIILITGHNSADAQRRADLTNMFERRFRLLAIVDAVDKYMVDAGAVRKSVIKDLTVVDGNQCDGV